MNKTLKNTIITAGIIIISFLIGYFISNKKTEFDACYEKCIEVDLGSGSTQNKMKTCVNLCGKN